MDSHPSESGLLSVTFSCDDWIGSKILQNRGSLNLEVCLRTYIFSRDLIF